MTHPKNPPLTLQQLRDANNERAEHWRQGAPPTPVDFDRIELAGEAGELLNEVKKLMRAAHAAMMSGDVVAMLQVYESLKGYTY